MYAGEEDDPRLLMKCLPGDPQKEKFREVDKLVKETITQLLDFIVEADMEEDAVYQLEEPETFNNPSSKYEYFIFSFSFFYVINFTTIKNCQGVKTRVPWVSVFKIVSGRGFFVCVSDSSQICVGPT